MATRSEASRARLYTAIERAMRVLPDMRVGQLIENAMADENVDNFYVEDEALAHYVDSYASRVKAGAS
jgi:hypothetical protein